MVPGTPLWATLELPETLVPCLFRMKELPRTHTGLGFVYLAFATTDWSSDRTASGGSNPEYRSQYDMSYQQLSNALREGCARIQGLSRWERQICLPIGPGSVEPGPWKIEAVMVYKEAWGGTFKGNNKSIRCPHCSAPSDCS